LDAGPGTAAASEIEEVAEQVLGELVVQAKIRGIRRPPSGSSAAAARAGAIAAAAPGGEAAGISVLVDLAGVEFLALLGIRQQVVGRGRFLELLLDLLVARVDVRMQAFRQLAIRLLDLVRRRTGRDAERLVGVGHANRSPRRPR